MVPEFPETIGPEIEWQCIQLFRERLSDESVKSRRRHRMAGWVFIGILHIGRGNLQICIFAREVLARIH